MENIILRMLEAMLSGGPEAIIGFLVLVIAGLIWERQRLLKRIDQKDEKIDKIVDDYYRGNLTLAEALTSLKVVLFEVKSRL